MNILNSVTFKAVVNPILNEVYEDQIAQRKNEYKALFTEKQGIKRNYQEDVAMYGTQTATEYDDGGTVQYSGGGVLYATRVQYRQYGLAVAFTKVLVEDSDHVGLVERFGRDLAKSQIEALETNTANVLNFAFNSQYVGGDGVPLVSSAHPIAYGSSFSNAVAGSAALSQTSLEQALIQLRTSVDNSGRRQVLACKHLVLPPALEFQGEVITKSMQRSGTADNDINPIYSTRGIKDGVHVVTRLTSPTAWFLHTDAPEGLTLAWRRKEEKTMEGDFETDSMRYKSTSRYIQYWHDPRCLWASAGA